MLFRSYNTEADRFGERFVVTDLDADFEELFKSDPWQYKATVFVGALGDPLAKAYTVWAYMSTLERQQFIEQQQARQQQMERQQLIQPARSIPTRRT